MINKVMKGVESGLVDVVEGDNVVGAAFFALKRKKSQAL